MVSCTDVAFTDLSGVCVCVCVDFAPLLGMEHMRKDPEFCSLEIIELCCLSIFILSYCDLVHCSHLALILIQILLLLLLLLLLFYMCNINQEQVV